MAATATKQMTETQGVLLDSLIKQVDLTVYQHARLAVERERGLTTKGASAWIGTFMEMRKSERAARKENA